MPRVAIKKKEYMAKDLRKWLICKMDEFDLNQEKLGELIGVSQSAFSIRMKKGMFSYSELLTLFKRLGATDDEILTMMKM